MRIPRRIPMYSFNSSPAVILVLLASTAALAQTRGTGDADAALKNIYTTEWAWREAQLPDDEDSQKPIADHLPDVGPKAQDARLQYWLEVRRRLDAIPRENLSLAGAVNSDVYRPQIEV